jgi:hypothetical protein
MVNELSKTIAKFLIEKGEHVSGEKDAAYRIDTTLHDSRRLTLVYLDAGGKGIRKPLPESRLEILIMPNTGDQIGFKTTEHGLTGKYSEFEIMTAHGPMITISNTGIHPNTIGQAQKQYDKILEIAYRRIFL